MIGAPPPAQLTSRILLILLEVSSTPLDILLNSPEHPEQNMRESHPPSSRNIKWSGIETIRTIDSHLNRSLTLEHLGNRQGSFYLAGRKEILPERDLSCREPGDHVLYAVFPRPVSHRPVPPPSPM